MIIGIGGVSRAGKSTLANSILEEYAGQKACLLHMDEYVKSGFNMPHIHDQLDWEDPESIDFQRLYYDFIWLISTMDVVILEGLFAFHDPLITSRYDRKILVEIDYQTFYNRKIRDKRWGEIPDWYIEHIWLSYDKYGIPSGEDILKIDGRQSINMKLIHKYLHEGAIV